MTGGMTRNCQDYRFLMTFSVSDPQTVQIEYFKVFRLFYDQKKPNPGPEEPEISENSNPAIVSYVHFQIHVVLICVLQVLKYFV